MTRTYPLAYSTTVTSANKVSGVGWSIILRGGRAVARWDSRYVANRSVRFAFPWPEPVRSRCRSGGE